MSFSSFRSSLGRALSAVFGSYTPPPWLSATGRGLASPFRRSPAGAAVTLVALAAAGWGSWEWWKWHEAHRPRPKVEERIALRDLTATVSSIPAPTLDKDDKIQLVPLSVRFSDAAAPLAELAPNSVATAATLKPNVDGKWRWRDDRSLEFLPAQPWPAGSTYEVEITASKLTPHTKWLPKQSALKVEVAPLTVKAGKTEFETDARDADRHDAVVEFTTNYPVSTDAMKSAVKVRVVGESKPFRIGTQAVAQAPEPQIVVDEKNRTRHFFVRTGPVLPPEREDFLSVSVEPVLQATVGGVALKEPAIGKVTLPTVTSGFSIGEARTQIVDGDDGEPQQILFVSTNRSAAPEKIAEAIEMLKLPPRPKAQGSADDEDPEPWKSAEELTPPIVAKATRIKLTPIPPSAPITTEHAFRFLEEKPGQVLVRIKAGVPAHGGFKLGKAFEALAEVPQFPVELRLLGSGAVLALNGEKKLSVKSRGVGHIRYTLSRVPAGQLNHLVSQTRGDFSAPEFRGWRFGKENITHVSRTVQDVAKRNDYEANFTAYDFAAALHAADAHDPDASRGLFFLDLQSVRPRNVDEDGEAEEGDPDPKWIQVKADGEDRQEDDGDSPLSFDSRFVLVTDLGLLVKENADDTRDVFIQSLQAAGPAAGVNLTVLAVNGTPLHEGATDAEGHAVLPALSHLKAEKRPVAIAARKGNDLAFIPWDRDDRKLDFSNFDTDGALASEKEALDGFVFTERGVYRPGDTLHIGAIVRRRDWNPDLGTVPITVEVRDPKNSVVGTVEQAMTPDGFLSFDVETSESSPTGVYDVHLLVKTEADGNDEGMLRIGRARVRVEDFQPDRMKLTAAFNRAAPGWLTPNDVKAVLKLETLFGFPAEGRRITGKLNIDPSDDAFEAFPGYRFKLFIDNEHRSEAGKDIDLGEQKTDAEGKAAFDLQLHRFSGASFVATVDLEGFEADGGRSVRTALRTLVSPLPTVVGWKADGPLDYIGKEAPRALQLIAITPEMKATALNGLTRRVIEIQNVSVLSKRDDGGYGYISTKQEKSVETAPLAIAAEGTPVPLGTARPGQFRVEIVNDGGDLLASVPFRVVGAGDGGRGLEKNAELEMTLARKTWKPGEAVEFDIRAPFAGAGLITVEREKVMGWKWFRSATSSGTQNIAVPGELEGSGYVGVSFVRGLDSPEIFTSPLSYAVQPFSVDPVRRRLPVEIDSPELVKPGETLKIGYRTPKASRIVVYAVDEGIHQITSYKLPEPVGFFFSKRALEVGTSQLLDQIMPEYTLLGRSRAFGGDGEEDPALKLGLNPFRRKKDAPVVFWSGILESGPDRRETTWQVPEYFSGRLAVMAVAVAPDALGAAQRKTTVRGPFVLTPNVPLFVAPDDEFTASLTVANNLTEHPEATSVTVSAEAFGGVEIVERPPAQLAVVPGKEASVRFRVKATSELGNAGLTFTASAAGETSSLKTTLSVRPIVPFMTHVQTGYFRQEKFDLATQRDLIPQFAKRHASASALPFGMAVGLREYLERFPYGCSEQITSQSMARLLFSGSKGVDRKQIDEQLANTFAVLRSRQAPSGGLGYWDASGVSSGIDWLSVYVAHFVLEAEAAQFAVPAGLKEGLHKRLQKMVTETPKNPTECAVLAHAIYLLTTQGEVTTNYVLNLRDTMERGAVKVDASDVSHAYLAATYALLQKTDEAEKLMTVHRAALAKLPKPAFSWYYESPLALQAQSLALVCKHFPKLASSIGYDQLRPVIEPLEKGQFSTVSSAQAILALRAYSGLQSQSGIKLGLEALPRDGTAPTMLAAPVGMEVEAPFEAAAKALRFQLIRPSTAPDVGAFYQCVEAGFDRAVPTARIADGVEAELGLFGEKGEPIRELLVGQGCRIELRVRNIGPNRLSHVASPVLLPGGFEIEAESLKPGVGTAPGTEYVDVREDRDLLFFPLAPAETKKFAYRIKGTCAGKFAVPPAFAESMYERDVKGRGVAGTVEVKSRD